MAKPKGTGFVPCTNCGGSGATDRTEITTDKHGNPVVKKIRVVCGPCGGKGGWHV